MPLPPLHRLTVAPAPTSVEPPSKKARVAPVVPGDDPSDTFRLDDDDDKNQNAWTTLRELLDDQMMDQWTPKECRGAPRQCIERKEFNERWCKDPLFWFALCRRFGWSVDGEARPRIYGGRVVKLEMPTMWRKYAWFRETQEQMLQPRPAQALVDNARAVRDYYDKHLGALRQRLKDNPELRASLTKEYRETYRRGCEGVDEMRGVAIAVPVVAFNPDSQNTGPMRRPQDDLREGNHKPIAWGALQRLLYNAGRMYANDNPAEMRAIRYRGTVDPVTRLAQGYGVLVRAARGVEAEIPLYEGYWADGDFEGTGKLYAETALVAIDPHPFATDGFSQQTVPPFLRIQATFKGGRANGPITVFGGMNRSAPWPRIYPELFWSINRSMKLFEGTAVDETVEGQGTQYHDARDCLEMAMRERGAGFRERWEELMRENPVFYEGQFKNGKKEGEGTLRMADGATYTGEFKEGERSGVGTQTWLGGEVYEGQWEDGKPNGEGTLTIPGSIHTGQFTEGAMTKGVIRYGNGNVYTGEARGGPGRVSRPHGSGEMIYENGDKYTGMWRGGQRHGEGERLYADNSVYKGTWVDDERHGKGTFTVRGNVDGDGNDEVLETYVGDWENDEKHGQGTMTSITYTYEGQWRGGRRSGQGTQQYSDGRRYKGQWGRDRQEGIGEMLYPNGDRYYGAWNYGDRLAGFLTYANGNVYVGQFALRPGLFADEDEESKGEMRYADGTVYDGELRDGKPHGVGKFTDADGTVLEGRFENGEFVGLE